MALAFAACIFPALAPVAAASSQPWAVLALAEVARGLPVAIAAAVPLWAATMAGGVADALRGSQETPSVPTVEGKATPLGVPSLGAARKRRHFSGHREGRRGW